MNFVTPKIAPPGLLDDAASDMGKKVSDYIGINMRYFSEQEFRYQKNSASGVIGYNADSAIGTKVSFNGGIQYSVLFRKRKELPKK